MLKTFFLTFDLEEFDLLQESGTNVNKKKTFFISYNGCKKILKILSKYNIKSTFFTTTVFAKTYPHLIKKIMKLDHEIGLHGYKHRDVTLKMDKFNLYNYLKTAKSQLEQITKLKIIGFREPRLFKPPFDILKNIGIKYDSSIHPTFIPGRYNNFFHSTKCQKIDDVFEIPISVVPIIRFPFSWVWFRNFGTNCIKLCTQLVYLNNSFVNLYFHSWEFLDLKKYSLPFYIRKNTGKKLIDMFKTYIEWCQTKSFRFITIREYVNSLNSPNNM